MPTIAITGAGSGIGHTFLTHFAASSSNTVHAMDVSFPDETSDSSASATIHRYKLNTRSDSEVADVTSKLEGQPIDLFIHSAAVRGLEDIPVKDEDPGAAETMDKATSSTMQQTLEINIVGSFLIIRALLPNLKKAEGKVVVMGSRMGSIGSNKDGSAYAYRASKAGLNAIIKSFSIDVPGIVFVVMHPGRVSTRMTPIEEPGSVSSEEAIKIMLPHVERFGKKDSGKFYTREGKEIPW